MDAFADLVPAEVRYRSGSVFYSGRAAFQGRPRVYVLGANPGGDPDVMMRETVEAHTTFVTRQANEFWSAYCDEDWGSGEGRAPLQRRVRHLLRGLRLEPRRTPASNLVFCRSRRIGELASEFHRLAECCWPMHEAVINRLLPSGIVCFGIGTGQYVARRLHANECVGSFEETNRRRWVSRAWKGPSGQVVFGLTHPGIADWTNPCSDPTPMVSELLGAAQDRREPA